MKRASKLPILIMASAMAAMTQSSMAARVQLLYVAGRPQVEFAGGEIRTSLASKGDSALPGDLETQLGKPVRGSFRIVIAASVEESELVANKLGLEPSASNVSVQAYSIRKVVAIGGSTYVVLAADPVGAMYGGLDLAEAVRLGTLASVKDSDHSPFIANRGIKFNVPLDVRTPSYSDAGDSAQQNIPEVWDIAFWHEFLDELARQRYNVLSLWNLHPFPFDGKGSGISESCPCRCDAHDGKVRQQL